MDEYKSWKRCRLRDRTNNYDFTIDCVIQDGKVSRYYPRYFGFLRCAEYGDYPVCLITDQDSVDYGTDFESDRYGNMKFFDQPMHVGAPFELTDSSGTYYFIVEDLG